jgi:hypothetical protein
VHLSGTGSAVGFTPKSYCRVCTHRSPVSRTNSCGRPVNKTKLIWGRYFSYGVKTGKSTAYGPTLARGIHWRPLPRYLQGKRAKAHLLGRFRSPVVLERPRLLLPVAARVFRRRLHRVVEQFVCVPSRSVKSNFLSLERVTRAGKKRLAIGQFLVSRENV